MDLKPGEVMCKVCNGIGDLGMTHKVYEYKSHGNTIKFPGELVIKECPKCYGAGKLDWIENVVGKKQDCGPWFAPAGFNKGKINAIKSR